MPGTLKSFSLAILCGLFLAGAAQAEQWKVAQARGEIWLSTASMIHPAALGSITDIPDGGTLTTGPGARVLLVRGDETMAVGPNAIVTVPRSSGGKTTIVQRLGEIVFDVDKQNVKHFSVETPFMAAVVKGTVFGVRVGKANAFVEVEEGRVEVRNHGTGESAEIVRGQRAAVRGVKAPLSLSGRGSGDVRIVPGKPRRPRIAPATGDEIAVLQAAAATATTIGEPGVGADGFVIVAGNSSDGDVPPPSAGTSADDAGPVKGLALRGGSERSIVANANTATAEVASAVVVATDAVLRPNKRRKPREDGFVFSNLTIAAGATGAVMLALGLAFVRSRFG